MRLKNALISTVCTALIAIAPICAQASEKSAYLTIVDESISGRKIADNPFRYVGERVDLHCTVDNIFDQNAFNANCGSADDDANVVVIHDTSGLSPGQSIRVIGVVGPVGTGTNMFGGTIRFPVVLSRFME